MEYKINNNLSAVKISNHINQEAIKEGEYKQFISLNPFLVFGFNGDYKPAQKEALNKAISFLENIKNREYSLRAKKTNNNNKSFYFAQQYQLSKYNQALKTQKQINTLKRIEKRIRE